MKKFLLIGLLSAFCVQNTYSLLEPVEDFINSGVQATQKSLNTILAMLFRSKQERDKLLAQLKQKFDHKPMYSNDISVDQAHKIMHEYSNWTAQHNAAHKQVTDEIREKYGNLLMYDYLKPYEKYGYLYFLFMKYWKSYCEREVQKRWNEEYHFYKEKHCSSVEKYVIKNILQEYGYSAAKALEISEKVSILSTCFLAEGMYVPFIDRIFLKKNCVQDLVGYHVAKTVDERKPYLPSVYVLLHEVGHYTYAMGHFESGFVDCIKEEQRADLEALAKIQKALSCDVSDIYDDFLGCDISLLQKGYAARSFLIRNNLFYDVQKKKIEEQFV